jgi:hypothetical protein
MKKLLLAFLLAFIGSGAFAQCTPNPMYQDSIFGVWPDTTTNFVSGTVGMPYFQQVDILVPSDAGLVDPQFEGVTLDSVQFTGISGLPPGLAVACNSQTPAACTYLSDQLGCGVIQGTPTQAGVYDFVLEVTAYSNLFGSPVPIPYEFIGYSITITEGMSIVEAPVSLIAGIRNVPNPFASRTAFEFSLARTADVQIKVFNLLGEELWSQKVQGRAGMNKVPFESGTFQEGVYLFKVQTGKESFTGRMVLHR